LFTTQVKTTEEKHMNKALIGAVVGAGLVGVLGIRRVSGNGLQRQCLLDYQRKIHLPAGIGRDHP
jgi:hypothetical protein